MMFYDFSYFSPFNRGFGVGWRGVEGGGQIKTENSNLLVHNIIDFEMATTHK